MKWKSFTIHTTAEAEDLVADLLAENGITGVEIRDKQQCLSDEDARLYKEVMPALPEDDGLAEVVFYLDEETEEGPLLAAITEGLEELRLYANVGSGKIDADETEDLDWINNWKAHFHAFMVDDILIKPTWVEKPADSHEAMMIEIDPGTAFGTGSHETTKLCISGIRKWMKEGDRVLDVGTGSGILSIAALKCGARYAFGTDIDPLAVETARENALLNGIPESDFTAVLGDIISDPETQAAAGDDCYDLVVANILADIIIPLQKEVTRHMKKGAILVTSGIIDLKEEAVRAALTANPELTIVDETRLGEWVSFTARKI